MAAMFKYILLNEEFYILFQILPKVVPNDAIDNKINTASDNDLVPPISDIHLPEPTLTYHWYHLTSLFHYELTHWGRVTHICVGNLTIIGSDNGLSPGWRKAIIWTNAGVLLIGLLGTHFSEILIEIHTFSFIKMHLKMSSAKWRPSCTGLKVLNTITFP